MLLAGVTVHDRKSLLGGIVFLKDTLKDVLSNMY